MTADVRRLGGTPLLDRARLVDRADYGRRGLNGVGGGHVSILPCTTDSQRATMVDMWRTGEADS